MNDFHLKKRFFFVFFLYQVIQHTSFCKDTSPAHFPTYNKQKKNSRIYNVYNVFTYFY